MKTASTVSPAGQRPSTARASLGGRALGALSAALLLALSAPASAQSRTGFAINRFEPAERGSQFFVNDTLDFRGDLRPAVGATLDYGYKPLVVYDTAGNERSALVRHQVFTHVGGALVLGDRVRFGLNLPVAVYQDGESTIVNGDRFKAADKAAIGDLRLAADVRVLGEYGDAFTLAGGVRAWLPTGQRSQFTGDGSTRLAPQVMAAGDLGAITYAARLALVYRARDDAYAGSPLGSELLGAAGAGLKALDGKLVIGPEVFATSVFTDASSFLKTRGTPAEWLFGAHYDVGDVRIGGGVGGGLTRGYGAPQLRALLSLEYVPAYERPDRDKDGVYDDEDACPDVAGVRDPDPRKNGCPAAIAPADADGDGITDAEDACPAEPGPRTNDPRTNGCPDRDRDGVVDKLDACPDVPGVQDADPKKNGCPPDRDGDGIADAEDACPDVPGPRDPDPKKNGCPLVVVTEKEIRINQEVKFKFDSAVILPESDAILDAVKQVLVAHPEIKKVRVEGHTDNVGKAAYNKTLSQKRAAAVVKWLTDKGVDKKRLVSQGYGQEQPLDSNETDQGRANNRRVAFTILERDAAAKPAEAPAPKP
ncbi:MAG: OmpA family protein [Labilithrix sp.]|nr:OmpA family protein [Labilithrix sp.]